MWECPRCDAEVEDGLLRCYGCGATPDECGATRDEEELPVHYEVGAMRPAAAGVPRQFGIGKLMAITTLFAVLFGLMKWMNFYPSSIAWVAVLVAGVGIAQALLFGGKKPRLASIIAGAVLFPLIAVGDAGIIEGRRFAWEFVLNPCWWVSAAIFGALFGYVAGILVASLFLWDTRDRDREDDSAT